MRKLDDAGETVTVSVKMPVTMRDALDETIDAEGHANRSDAARHAIEKGLNGKVKKPKTRERAMIPPGKCPHPLARRIGTGCGRCGQDPV